MFDCRNCNMQRNSWVLRDCKVPMSFGCKTSPNHYHPFTVLTVVMRCLCGDYTCTLVQRTLLQRSCGLFRWEEKKLSSGNSSKQVIPAQCFVLFCFLYCTVINFKIYHANQALHSLKCSFCVGGFFCSLCEHCKWAGSYIYSEHSEHLCLTCLIHSFTQALFLCFSYVSNFYLAFTHTHTALDASEGILVCWPSIFCMQTGTERHQTTNHLISKGAALLPKPQLPQIVQFDVAAIVALCWHNPESSRPAKCQNYIQVLTLANDP